MPTSAPVLVYDADCAFCTRCAQWLAARATCRVEPWQSLDLAAVGLTPEQVRTAAWWLPGGTGTDTGTDAPRGGARAVAASLRACRGTALSPVYRAAGVLVDLPPVRPLAALVYRWVAANRYRLPGGTAACRLED
ncbi:thiol-disulfide oxidoreductase DCC family protein [Nocardioides bruguierae]|uniref:DUF393 domain-containing protein n=1 Tax=Nocardioides bruguierae TaxID=2945102 RepID=A0A9X2IF77_9ACTN|nr:DCC1-like thiol-disulfide oxidoreductase family protein [Nocardioides bruguierae]MCM0621037.1 DUF393 domain-containing protein [Nocardioides bruguierae]